MTIDKEKLKVLAEAANAVTTDVNITMAAGSAPEEVKAVQDYIQQAMPKTILALLAEIEQLRDSYEQVCGNYSRVSFASEERGKQIDQLKAENEALRSGRAIRRLTGVEVHEAFNQAYYQLREFCSYGEQLRIGVLAVIDAAMAKEASNG
ncbi:hypothetical protein [Pseudomonas monteilii]|uniref:hypothetical protein n=1 Tax=Pseudomonas monteilii TaxID=76759 RepID=UPI0018A88595|nr:hypothetical protein [Pseudomonas monteilii]MBF8746879.1 hypothetical protein [Pseudomonas monteilii]